MSGLDTAAHTTLLAPGAGAGELGLAGGVEPFLGVPTPRYPASYAQHTEVPHGYQDLYSSQTWRGYSHQTSLSRSSPQSSHSPTEPGTGVASPQSPHSHSQFTPSPHSSPVGRPAPSPTVEYSAPSHARASEGYYAGYNQHYYQTYYFSHRTQDWTGQ